MTPRLWLSALLGMTALVSCYGTATPDANGYWPDARLTLVSGPGCPGGVAAQLQIGTQTLSGTATDREELYRAQFFKAGEPYTLRGTCLGSGGAVTAEATLSGTVPLRVVDGPGTVFALPSPYWLGFGVVALRGDCSRSTSQPEDAPGVICLNEVKSAPRTP